MWTLAHTLILSAILFVIGVLGVMLNRRNVIVVLMAIELMLLAVNTNFIAFSHYWNDMRGQVFVFFILTVAAAEAAIGLAILLTVFRKLVTIAGVALSFLLSVWTLWQVIQGAGYDGTVYEWMRVATPFGALKFEVGFLIDALTALMMCVVTFVSLMVHLYTIGYMRDDSGYTRFFAYLSLFTFAMLMLVMSNNFLQLFFGWEAVGLISYLLIGFWYTKESAIKANMKAFIVNRVGDFGFILGIGLLFAFAGSLHYGEVFKMRTELAGFTLPGSNWGLLTVTCLCLFIGAMGKSAQFPLHVWLPDSMEGPTPISVLIHAATMVTAGIFMVTRMSPLFELSESTLSFMMAVGATTALFMGILGLVQNDIKRVVAYSTLSQLGDMTVALGASAYSMAVFHLVTHAFFKALLFLAAGSVIIGMHHEQDMRNMGGLRRAMPVTWATALIGALALIGAPFFSGFYSKDAIIEAVRRSHLPGAGFAAFALIASVFVTALYTFRMIFLVFYGPPRGHSGVSGHEHTPHESPRVITLPLVLLAIPSLVIGAWMIGPLLSGDFFARGVAFNSVVFVADRHSALREISGEFHGWFEMAMHALTTLPVWLASTGRATAAWLYLRSSNIPAALKQRCPRLYALLDQKYYLDTVHEIVFARGAVMLGSDLAATGEQKIIDGAVNGSARSAMMIARAIRALQTGDLTHYALAMVAGLAALIVLFVRF